MSLVNIDTEKAAVAAVDEAAEKFPPALDPVLKAAADHLIEGLRGVLVGRKITITIE